MKIKLKITGMHCDSCAKLIQSELQDKVNTINIDSKKGIALIDFDNESITETEIKNIIINLGYSIT